MLIADKSKLLKKKRFALIVKKVYQINPLSKRYQLMVYGNETSMLL